MAGNQRADRANGARRQDDERNTLWQGVRIAPPRGWSPPTPTPTPSPSAAPCAQPNYAESLPHSEAVTRLSKSISFNNK